MEAAFKQELQKQSYTTFSLKYLPAQTMSSFVQHSKFP